MENEEGQAQEVVTEASENDNVKLENETLKRELQSKEAAVAGLEQALAGKDGEIAALKQSLEEAKQESVEVAKELSQAVAAYKGLAAQANPGLVAEMIKGDTIEEIDESVKSASALVERIKQEVGAENAKARVPAGAPQRIPPDLSGLTPREKIMYAMEGAG